MTTDWIDRVRETSLSIGRDTARAMEKTSPSAVPAYTMIGTGQAVFCGQGSPLTQVSWLAYKTGFDQADLVAVREFFDGRADTWEYIVTPYSDPALLSAVVTAGWTEVQYENVMARPVTETAVVLPEGVGIHVVQGSERRAWADLATTGFFGDEVPPGFENLTDIIVNSDNMVGFVATLDGQPAGAASLMVGRDAVYLGGASTLPQYRGKGIQSSLLQARIAHAHALGIGLALCECLVGSQSQRNQEKAGFQVVYTKMVLTKPGQH